jgi:PncC family amidohydrolase
LTPSKVALRKAARKPAKVGKPKSRVPKAASPKKAPHSGGTSSPKDIHASQGNANPTQVLRRLERLGLTVGVAESCTGGLVGARLTQPAGASASFVGGVVAYSDQVKTSILGVGGSLLRDGPGAVSAAVAEAMAHGARLRLGCDIAVAVTGIAGPSGGRPGKPVGTVWLAVVGPEHLVHVHRLQATGGRAKVREAAVREAIRLIGRALDEAEQEGVA